MELLRAQEIYKSKPHQVEIELAIALEEETRYYTERFISSDKAPNFHQTFLNWSKDRLSNDRSYNNFIRSLTYPLKTSQFIDDIYSKLNNIWEAQNPFIKVSIKDNVDDKDKEIDLTWWKETAWNLLKIRHNSILLVDLPVEQKSELPEPYISIIDINNIIDIESKNNVISYIMFKFGELVAVVDKEVYQLFVLNNDKTEITGIYTDEKGNLFNNKHTLDYCPAFFLSDIKYRDCYEIPRINPLTNCLGKFRNILFLDTLKDITDPHAFYNFIIKYGSTGNCGYDDGQYHCVDGKLFRSVKDSEGMNAGEVGKRTQSGAIEKCPKCNTDMNIGDTITLPLPTDPSDKAIASPIQFASPDKDILDWRNNYLKSLYDDLSALVLGNDQELNAKLNHNETAYRYNIEGKQSILIRWKTVFEKVIKSITDAKLKIKYPLGFESSHIDLGSDFLLLDIQDLYTEKESAEKLGLGTILNFNDRIIETKYKNNPDLKLRARVINSFKPFDEPLERTEASFIAKNISKIDYFKVKYLEQFINWFENEVGDISSIAKNKSIKIAVDELNIKFNEYYDVKIKQVETSQKMLSEIIGVGGTQSMISILTDRFIDDTQKSLLLQKLFNISKEEADAITIKKEPLNDETKPPIPEDENKPME